MLKFQVSLNYYRFKMMFVILFICVDQV